MTHDDPAAAVARGPSGGRRPSSGLVMLGLTLLVLSMLLAVPRAAVAFPGIPAPVPIPGPRVRPRVYAPVPAPAVIVPAPVVRPRPLRPRVRRGVRVVPPPVVVVP